MKEISLLLILVLVLLFKVATTWAADSDLTIQPLNRQLEDAGCSFVLRNAKEWVDYPILISDPDGVWMNINGKTVKLNDVSDPEKMGSQSFESGHMRVLLRFGRGKENEGGVTYKRATLTVTDGKTTKVIKVKGGCGC
jgi:hypothetical protein